MDIIAFKCYDCNTINVFPTSRGDGNGCLKCSGMLTPVGEAIYSRDYKSPRQCIHKFIHLSTTDNIREVTDLFYCERCLIYEKRIRPGR
jgi:hypothetical protein